MKTKRTEKPKHGKATTAAGAIIAAALLFPEAVTGLVGIPADRIALAAAAVGFFFSPDQSAVSDLTRRLGGIR